MEVPVLDPRRGAAEGPFRIYAAYGTLQESGIDVRSDDREPPVGQVWNRRCQGDGDRIRLLAAATGRAPNAHVPLAGPLRLHERREDLGGQNLECAMFTKEIGLANGEVIGEDVDLLLSEWSRVEPINTSLDIGKIKVPSNGTNPAFEIGPAVSREMPAHACGNEAAELREDKIGEGCNIGQNVVVSPQVVLGKNVKVQNNISIYEGVICEDDVFLGPSMVFTNVINPRSFIERKHELKNTTVRRGATIGANASIVCGIEIGAYAMVGAGAVVTKPVAAFALVTGNPAGQNGWVSEQGHTLNFDKGRAFCTPEQQAYILQDNRVQKS